MRNLRTTARAGALLILIVLAVLNCTVPGGAAPRRLSGFADEDLIDKFRGLHAPIYSVYSMGPDKDAVHDLLAASFAGRALTREYVEHFSTLVWMQQEQTAIEVLKVNYEQVELLRAGVGQQEEAPADDAGAAQPSKRPAPAAIHPAYNYLARRYGLGIRSFDFDPE